MSAIVLPSLPIMLLLLIATSCLVWSSPPPMTAAAAAADNSLDNRQLLRRSPTSSEVCQQAADKVDKCFSNRWHRQQVIHPEPDDNIAKADPSLCCFIMEISCAFKPMVKQCFNGSADDELNKEMKLCADGGFQTNVANCATLKPSAIADSNLCTDYKDCFLVSAGAVASANTAATTTTAAHGLQSMIITVTVVIVLVDLWGWGPTH
ncbi:uncharacterized protein LOC128962247 [Oppia nitens]|uniref:uncharacterized protein LOC128962247 n=1 Tax=Oppia nitens TaxID=1686743 RepID=UPI0023DC5E1B|nr:uncharacterized protein LOC128962247 [Oppia nitens]